MCGDYPEPVILTLECLYRRSLVQIPHPDSLVATGRENQVLMRVEQASLRILKVSSAGVYLPRLGFAHAPKLYQSIITSRNNQGHMRMESNPIDTAIMALQDEFDDSISVSKHVSLILVGASDLILEAHGRGGGVLLSEPGNVPDTDSLIEGGGHDEIFFRVELGAHSVMIVSGHSADCQEWSVCIAGFSNGRFVLSERFCQFQIRIV